ncbi:MAG: glycosyltransferase [Lachnospiraceae bacterium]|nr:glycosyltransferase [Lachnospiraceae bacterium]MBR5994209.1 glycosyltransferase [Lachnospiraceae bacterium]
MGSLISVVVPVYNVKQYLDDCMESIVHQTYENIEIILVDDGSTDGSGEMCDAWKEKDARIKVVHQKNGGLSAARNTGIEASTGEYIVFIDSDDMFETDAVMNLYNCATSLSADLVVGQGLRVDENGERITEGKYADVYEPGGEEYVISKEEFWKHFSDNLYFIVAWSKLYKRELFKHVQFPVGQINEDFAIAKPLIENVNTIAYMGKRMYKYRIRQGSIMRSPLSEKNLFFLNERIKLMQYILDNDFSAQGKYYICRIQFSAAMEVLERCFSELDTKDKRIKNLLVDIYKGYKPMARVLLKGIDGSVNPDMSTKITLHLYLISRVGYFFFRRIKKK